MKLLPVNDAFVGNTSHWLLCGLALVLVNVAALLEQILAGASNDDSNCAIFTEANVLVSVQPSLLLTVRDG